MSIPHLCPSLHKIKSLDFKRPNAIQQHYDQFLIQILVKFPVDDRVVDQHWMV